MLLFWIKLRNFTYLAWFLLSIWPISSFLEGFQVFVADKVSKDNSLHLGRKYARIFVLWTLSVPRSSQFSSGDYCLCIFKFLELPTIHSEHSLKFIGLSEVAAFSLTNLFFPHSHFSLLSGSHSLSCLSQFAPPASRKKNEQPKNSLHIDCNAKH